MRIIIFAVLMLVSAGIMSAQASEQNQPENSGLEAAYQREILFLSTYKKELLEKRVNLEKTLGAKASKAKIAIQALEDEWLSLQASNEVLLQKVNRLERESERKVEHKDGVADVLAQAEITFDLKLDGDVSSAKNIQRIFEKAQEGLIQSQTLWTQSGLYFDQDGLQKNGTLLNFGGIAKFAQVDSSKFIPLYPTGEGHFRIWSKGNAETFMGTGIEDLSPSLGVFVFSDPNKAFRLPTEKNWKTTLAAGGLIGWVIVALGIMAFVLSLLRFRQLKNAQIQNERELTAIVDSVAKSDLMTAQTLCLARDCATTRVVGKTLVALQKNPETVEDVIVEGIVAESQIIDRYGVFILVIASVAPLLGLLGTVTGMISTFDIITQFGTGNPKLLSGGISEALITTMFGLMVAIPTLLVGQYLGTINENIKADMEKWALAISNAFNSKTSPS